MAAGHYLKMLSLAVSMLGLLVALLAGVMALWADESAATAREPTIAEARADDKAPLVDSTIPRYRPTSGVSGTIKSVGSDTMNNLMTLWAEGFKYHYPNVRAEIEGKGSSTAPPALIAGTATFGPMSRDMKASEIDAFDAKYGYKPVLLPAAIDMLAVYVHRDNPIERLTLLELDAMYSQHRKGGFPRAIRAGEITR